MATLRLPLPAPYAKSTWSITLALTACYFAWVLAWYWPVVTQMVSFWHQIETYAHGFVIVPIAGWLIWRKRDELATLRPSPSAGPVPLALMFAASMLWLGGEVAEVIPARQFALVTFLIGGIWLIVGNQVARSIAFPLTVLYFAVPVGEFLVPTMIEWTADFTVAALRLSGVPVYREGMVFRIPSGSWSVIEACSGIRYLTASVTVGVLFAYLTYRSLSRRLLFVLASVLVPIVANWLRAYMIVMIGHISNNRLAVGVDHILYGWVFFGVVMLLLFVVGSIWREDTDSGDARHASGMPGGRRASSDARWSIAALAFVIVATPPILVRALHERDLSPVPVDRTAPVLGEWKPVASGQEGWLPHFTPPRTTMASAYERAGDKVGLYVALYYSQDSESKLVSSSNQLIVSSDHRGNVISDGQRVLDLRGQRFDVNEALLRYLGQRVLVRRWYWIDGTTTSNSIRAKLLQARARLLGRGDAGAIILVYASVPEEGQVASPALDDFTEQVRQYLPAILSERLSGGPGDPR